MDFFEKKKKKNRVKKIFFQKTEKEFNYHMRA